MPHTLLIPLVGPMQAWGSRSRFEDRDTHPEPTKSGVVGLLCAALGRPRSVPLDDLAALRFGVRVERVGVPQVDFHTVQNVRTADGKVKDTLLSYRHFLADAWFVAGLEGESLDLLQQLEAALRDPVWPLALGRKSFPLALPPYFPDGSIREGVALKAALEHEPLLQRLPGANKGGGMRIQVERSSGSQVQADQVYQFDGRRFSPRRFDVYEWSVDALPSHVPFSHLLPVA